MSKKKITKKHKFKHVEADIETVVNDSAERDGAAALASSARPRVAALAVSGRDFSYVGNDLRRIVMMAIGLVAIELAMYVALTHTPAGTAIYNLVKI